MVTPRLRMPVARAALFALGLTVLAPSIADAALCRDRFHRMIRCPDTSDPIARCADARGFKVSCGLPGSVVRGIGDERGLVREAAVARRYGDKRIEDRRYLTTEPVDPKAVGRVGFHRAGDDIAYQDRPRPQTPGETRRAQLRGKIGPDPYGTLARDAAKSSPAAGPYDVGSTAASSRPYRKPVPQN